MMGGIIDEDEFIQRECLQFDSEQPDRSSEGANLLKLQSRQSVLGKPLHCYSPKVQNLLAPF